MNIYRRRFLDLRERFESLIEIVPWSGCWIWLATTDPRSDHMSYGKFWINDLKKSIGAHRASWNIYMGPIPSGMIVLHRCDVPCCVNPNHLFLGTNKDNTKDMMTKGRDWLCRQSRRGGRSNFSKLTTEKVIEIRRDNRPQREIAFDFGITQSAVSLIKRRKNWKHVNADAA